MSRIKALLYCTKVKPYLNLTFGQYSPEEYTNSFIYYTSNKLSECEDIINGTIVACCEIETEDLKFITNDPLGTYDIITNSITNESVLLYWSKLTSDELYDYLDLDNKEPKGYALHIYNLIPFVTPLNFKKNCIYKEPNGFNQVLKASQNMQKVYDRFGNKYILISISSNQLEKILNYEQTILIRKKVLKEML